MLIYIIFKVIDLLLLAIFAQSILTWMPYNKTLKGVYDFLGKVTDPILSRVYRLTSNKLISGGLDLTPMVACLLLYAVKRAIVLLV
ncbi:MAG: YggT family protein [Peptostreptococcaceae bacterium]|nr:YggT family protein [Peptostreptococcaceae bacterium]